MRGTSLLLLAAICCTASLALPQQNERDHEPSDGSISQHMGVTPTDHAVPEAVPSNGTPVVPDPSIAYAPRPGVPSHDEDMDMDTGDMDNMDDMDMDGINHEGTESGPRPQITVSPEDMSYWLWLEHRGLLYTHIALMIIAWGFVLPVGRVQTERPLI
jgi:hypothetical protein